jgi:acetate kinase
MRTLIINVGSSTLKWSVLDNERSEQHGGFDWQANDDEARRGQLATSLHSLSDIDAVGHRVVHGGHLFVHSVRIDTKVRQQLESLVPLDPIHMRPALLAIDATMRLFPKAPQIAAFDTAFHSTIPQAAAGYGLPFEWSERFGLKRFGFHGLSVAYSIARVTELTGAQPRRLVVCHLGSGCSVTAVENGRSIDTTMGFTPLEGMMMATRAGSLDPGLLLYLQTNCKVSVAELSDVLANRSGLLGVSGISGDMRTLLAAVDQGNERAQLAYDRFIVYGRRAIGAMSGALGGLDALVFTGGIAERSARVRKGIAHAIDADRLVIDEKENEALQAEGCISVCGSYVRALVIQAREDLMIQREVVRVLTDAVM